MQLIIMVQTHKITFKNYPIDKTTNKPSFENIYP